jgi:hypothetical protein
LTRDPKLVTAPDTSRAPSAERGASETGPSSAHSRRGCYRLVECNTIVWLSGDVRSARFADTLAAGATPSPPGLQSVRLSMDCKTSPAPSRSSAARSSARRFGAGDEWLVTRR